jgi:hypothetical protein
MVGVDWDHLARDRRAPVYMAKKSSDVIKAGAFLNWLRDYWHIKKVYASWNQSISDHDYPLPIQN